MLKIAEVFYSVQGEGSYTGTPAVFVRLAGCNLSCDFCDTDYSIKRFMTVRDVADEVRNLSPDCPMVIITGGEPTIQTDFEELVRVLQADGKKIHVESNGTTFVELPLNVWLTVSPKSRVDERMAQRANEAKLIVDRRVPSEWLDLFSASTRIFLQPEGNKPENIRIAIEAVKKSPSKFRLSLQTHKFINIR